MPQCKTRNNPRDRMDLAAARARTREPRVTTTPLAELLTRELAVHVPPGGYAACGQAAGPMTSPDTATLRLGIAVRKRRKLLGLTQEALARAAGCGLVFVYNLERGKPSLRLDKLLDILHVLGMDIVVKLREHEGETSTP